MCIICGNNRPWLPSVSESRKKLAFLIPQGCNDYELHEAVIIRLITNAYDHMKCEHLTNYLYGILLASSLDDVYCWIFCWKHFHKNVRVTKERVQRFGRRSFVDRLYKKFDKGQILMFILYR